MDKMELRSWLVAQDLAQENNDRDKIFKIHDHVITEFLLKKFPELCVHTSAGMQIGIGWVPLMIELCEALELLKTERPGLSVEFVQVKEKFGGLRCYYNTQSASPDTLNIINSIVKVAEEKAWRTCEVCGEPGTINRTGWLQVTCPQHTKGK